MIKRSLRERIQGRIKMTLNGITSDCHFSFYYAVLRLLDEFGGRLGLKSISNSAHKHKDKWIIDYLCEKYCKTIIKYKTDVVGNKIENSPIWVCWWTGEETAPELVQKCIQSIKKCSGRHQVIFIDKNNYFKYVNIPDYMLEKVRQKKMGLAHLADYIRVSLIAKYGGLWLDSTIFCSKKIPDNYFSQPFFTCKSEEDPDSKFISKMRWTTFILGGYSGNIVFLYLKEMLEEYWKNEDVAIDYLLFDYIIEIGYEKSKYIKKMIDNVPINNIHRDELQAAMNAAEKERKFHEIINSNTVLYKLSWRETYSLKTADGEESIYSYFLKK